MSSETNRPLAPPGRRRCEVLGNRPSGSYMILSALDRVGPLPRPGQFYMLATAEGWGSGTGRPFLPRAFSVAAAAPAEGGVRLEFLAEEIGPGTARLGALAAAEGLLLTGPLGRPFSLPTELVADAAGSILVGGGIGIAPIALLRRELRERGSPVATLLGFRERERSGGLDLFSGSGGTCPGVRLASEDGHAGHRGYVTELLATMLEGDDAESAAVYACGPPAMLEAVRGMCERAGVAAELALEAPMACGFGACMGCAMPLAAGGYMRLCVDGPVVKAELIDTALVPGSGHR